jgi:peptidoglycan hydrolase CwlO-like protein
VAVAGLIASFVLGSAPVFADTTQAERAALEAQLAELELQIVEHEATVQTLNAEGKSLEGAVSTLNAKIDVLNLKIKAITGQLQQLDEEIGDREVRIRGTIEQIDFNRDALARAVQKVYETSETGLIEVLLRNPNLSGFFGDINNLRAVQSSLVLTIDKITGLKDELVEERELLALQRNDAQALKEYQDSQRQTIQSTKVEKNRLLQDVKGKEAESRKILTETKKTAAEIRSRIFQLLGGGELTFEEAYNFAKLAEGATGVRAALILAVLDRESALGHNVGKCPYYSAEKDRYYMHPTRDVPAFLEITKKLGLNADTMLVSCPNSDGAYGGAMGPAQFIPSTWQLYEAGIAKVTGSSPPSPWRNADAFVATGLYLSDALSSSACKQYGAEYAHILPRQFLEERCAAAKYYAGGRWFTYRFAYGDPVVERADTFQEDIAILNG